ncbi:superoxide dismutase [Fe] [bacterium]|nr:superoxide dismutase [Fe] [bacterium]
MTFALPDLPYARSALEPHISAETLEYHYGKHHAAYVANLNKLVPGTEFEDKSLDEIVKTAPPGGALADAVNAAFGSFAKFKETFSTSAATNFGSGWTWLVKNADGGLEILNTSNAGSALTSGLTPLLVIDVWEHAYYVDTRNARPKYVENWWNLVNWDFATRNFAG